MDNKFDNEKKGYLWHENDSVIERKGSFTIDGKKHYGAIVKSANNEGEFKYEFMVSIGLLHLNDEKRNEKSPDMGGRVTLNNNTYKLGCWARESEKGAPYTSLGFQEVEEEHPVDYDRSKNASSPKKAVF